MRGIITAVFVAGVMVGGADRAAAQSGLLQAGAPLDIAISGEIMISGKVLGVIGIPDAEGAVGLHLKVTSGKKVYNVHLGPAMFIGMANFWFKVGDQVDVGGTLEPGTGSVVIARSVTRAGRVLTLRSADGVPAWTPNAEGSDGCGVAHAQDVESE
jgi:hypothetical protein